MQLHDGMTTSYDPLFNPRHAPRVSHRVRNEPKTAAHPWLMLIGLIVGINLLGLTSGLSGDAHYYLQLNRPAFAPSLSVFAPVWMTLYTLMAIATWFVLQQRPTVLRRDALIAFAAQLLLNLAWSPIFFGMRAPTLALIVILANLVTVLSMMRLYYRVTRPAGVLIAPLAIWVAFASMLNVALCWLN